MKKHMVIFGLLSVLMIAVLLVGCGGGGGAQTTSPGGVTTPVGTTTPGGGTPTSPSGGSLGQILGHASTYQSVYYEMVTTIPGQASMTIKYWMKGDKMRMEMADMGIITLMDMGERTMYYYTPATNTAMKMTYDDSQVPDEPGDILDYYPDIVGTEIFDGKECTVIEYGHAGESIKAWIWNETGFPVKMEVTSGGVTTTVVWRNFDFSNIPDSIFELPEGVEIMDFGL